MKYLLIILLFISCSKEAVEPAAPTLTRDGIIYTLTYKGEADAVMIEYYNHGLGGYCPRLWKEWAGNVHTFQIPLETFDYKWMYRGVIIFKDGRTIYSNVITL